MVEFIKKRNRYITYMLYIQQMTIYEDNDLYLKVSEEKKRIEFELFMFDNSI